MNHAISIITDLIAISVLVFAIYFPRYHRKDMVLAILSLNIGVMAVATALSTAEVSAGLGLGLFGVLSILRLRSTELNQEEVAYYFSSLALGLIAGLVVTPIWVTPVLMFVIVAVMFVADHPLLLSASRHQSVVLDVAYANEAQLKSRLEELFDARVVKMQVTRIDFVNDTTSVDVRYRRGRAIEPATDDSALAAARNGHE